MWPPLRLGRKASAQLLVAVPPTQAEELDMDVLIRTTRVRGDAAADELLKAIDGLKAGTRAKILEHIVRRVASE